MSTSSHTPTDLQQLDDRLGLIHQQLVRQNSFFLAFVRGLFTGLGASVGVTVVLGVVIFVLTQIARALGIEAILQQILSPLHV